MNGFPDWNEQPSGVQPERPAQQKRSAGLLLSGILIAISLLAFVFPLAAYHVAQVASVLRLRSAVLLMAAVSMLIYFLGMITRLPVFVMAGTLGILSLPFLWLSLMFRFKNRSALWALLVLALPVVLMMSSLLGVPQGFNVEAWLTANIAGGLGATNAAQAETLLRQLKESRVIDEMQRFLDQESWERLAWLLFADSGSLSVFVLGSLAATVVLIDFAFNQTERMHFVLRYVLANREVFPHQMVFIFQQTAESMKALMGRKRGAPLDALTSGVVVQAHVKKPTRGASESGNTAPWSEEKKSGSAMLPGWLRRLAREPNPPSTTDIFGYRFTLSAEPGWRSRLFAVPLWLAVPALAMLLYMSSLWQGDAELGSWLPAEPKGPVLVWGALAALMVLVGLALQGALIVHACLRPLVALAAVFAILLLSSSLDGGPFLVVAVLAGVGLLDNAYDFRNRLAKNKNAV
ncbi:MAG: hypothetical protein FJY29_10565 [Betaproteobacteria bacterium]|nr:hypothetical protein [Betaproteobacteria bacterium]